jgi:signal transduction histidine kinase
VSRQIWSTEADVKLDLDRTLPPLSCDVMALKQAFFDILMAAVERAPKPVPRARVGAPRAAPANGLQISIRSRRVESGVEIEFHDDGPALPAELQRELEHPGVGPELLEQIDRRGLGMAYSVVAVQHMGRLIGRSPAGQGATLIVRLPEGLPSPRARVATVAPSSARA